MNAGPSAALFAEAEAAAARAVEQAAAAEAAAERAASAAGGPPAGPRGGAGAAVTGAAGGPELTGQDGAGEPDAFERLWTPHRMAYIKGEGKPASRRGVPVLPGTGRCPTRTGLILARGELVYAVLNLYPYNSGHLMIVPYRHVADYTDLTARGVRGAGRFTQRAMTAVRAASGAHGFNIGMNQGSVAGAGIAAHLHQHVVPRWGGDTNFMPVVGRTRVLPQLLGDTRTLIAAAWPAA